MTKMINFSVEPTVFRAAPRYVRYILVSAADPDPLGGPDLSDEIRAQTERLSADPEASLSAPQLELWRSTFRGLGINPNKFRSSVDALVRRAAGGAAPVLGQVFVDAGTVATLTHMAPIGVHVLDEIGDGGTLRLREATPSDEFVAFDGSIEHPDPGEIVYADDRNRVLTRRWVWRQGRLGSVAPDSRQFAVNVDLIDPAIYPGDLLELLVSFFGRIGLADAQVLRLDAENPTASAAVN